MHEQTVGGINNIHVPAMNGGIYFRCFGLEINLFIQYRGYCTHIHIHMFIFLFFVGGMLILFVGCVFAFDFLYSSTSFLCLELTHYTDIYIVNRSSFLQAH